MKTLIAMTLLTLSFSSLAQTKKLPETKCAAFARGIMRTAFRMDTKGVFQLVDVKNMKEFNDAAGENIPLEQLTYMSEGATVVIKSIPDYYKKGECELSSIDVGRE